MLICARIFDGNFLVRRHIVHDCPLTKLTLTGPGKFKVCRSGANFLLANINSCDVLRPKAWKAACRTRDHSNRNRPDKPDDHARTPSRYRAIPAVQHPARVGIIPILKRKIARIAASERASAHGSMLESLGASNESGKAFIG